MPIVRLTQIQKISGAAAGILAVIILGDFLLPCIYTSNAKQQSSINMLLVLYFHLLPMSFIWSMPLKG